MKTFALRVINTLNISDLEKASDRGTCVAEDKDEAATTLFLKIQNPPEGIELKGNQHYTGQNASGYWFLVEISS